MRSTLYTTVELQVLYLDRCNSGGICWPLCHFLLGAIIVYDVSDEDSFGKVKTWFQELKKYLGPDVPKFIAGNKADMPNRAVPQEEAESYATSVGLKHVYTSAKTGQNVNQLFNDLT